MFIHPNVEPQLNFSSDSLNILNVCLAFIMFGVALSIKPAHFIQLKHTKRTVFTGLASQYLLLPAITWCLVMLLKPSPGIAMGMFLVAACPGGNASNFFTQLARGHVALSVTLTAFSSLLAFFITPLNFFFWSALVPGLAHHLRSFEISFADLLLNMMGILLLPLLLGMGVNRYFHSFAKMIAKSVRVTSIVLLIAFIAVALYFNQSAFKEYIFLVFGLVVAHNGLALVGAYGLSYLVNNSSEINRTIAIETGIQNSGLALVLIFNFFNGNGYMALIAAWWGVWHLVSGFAFAWFFQRKLLEQPA